MVKLFLLLFSAAKFGKLLTMGGTMLFSMLAYSWIFGWRYAVGFVLLILFHELGHYMAARQRGLNVGVPTFIPFVGAWIQMKEQPTNVETEAYIAFAGPVIGTLAAMGCYWLARESGSQLMLALAYAGCMINLFNLIPLSPLDGGRITAIISPKIWLLGLPLLVGLFFYNHSPMLILIVVLAYPQIKQAIWPNPNAIPQGYYEASFNDRTNYAVLYLGLVVFLSLMTYLLHSSLSG
ncbi:Peptidase family M50 [Marinomonas spartinae]|uniref:Peptidase family M50 n=1 Tax=Marinomonas spartinae TaxID=1792290 RepID=A0A1A8TSS7_9GAMM|nr:site-2 protease family protein [Marinomonas spartinae]SBS31671.1 Peptidase family M50 [Marinomonas spartinae]SBS36367.1 Peptidase family M50 [Marinomonas spartinae]